MSCHKLTYHTTAQEISGRVTVRQVSFQTSVLYLSSSNIKPTLILSSLVSGSIGKFVGLHPKF